MMMQRLFSGFLFACALGSAPAAADVLYAHELDAVYPNGIDHSIQEAVERLCGEAQSFDRVTLHLGAGTYTEQVSTTIGCKKPVSWRFVGAGVGETVFRIPSTFSTSFHGVSSKDIFSGIIACGRAYPVSLPEGGFSCTADSTVDNSLELCKLAAGNQGTFQPHETSCEVSDLSLISEDNRGRSAIVAAWSPLKIHNVEVTGFYETQLGCLNCKDLEIEHVELSCPSGAVGISIGVNTTSWPDNFSSGAKIHDVDIQGCRVGIQAQLQTDADFSHNRIVRSGFAFLLGNVVLSSISFNHLSSNLVGLVRDCAAANGGNQIEHNLKFGAGALFRGCGQPNDDFTVYPEGNPQGW